MKSIKEKAIEVFPRHCNANTDASNLKKRIGFNRGANYVLDLLIAEDDRYDTVIECYPALTRIIRELKSNQ